MAAMSTARVTPRSGQHCVRTWCHCRTQSGGPPDVCDELINAAHQLKQEDEDDRRPKSVLKRVHAQTGLHRRLRVRVKVSKCRVGLKGHQAAKSAKCINTSLGTADHTAQAQSDNSTPRARGNSLSNDRRTARRYGRHQVIGGAQEQTLRDLWARGAAPHRYCRRRGAACGVQSLHPAWRCARRMGPSDGTCRRVARTWRDTRWPTHSPPCHTRSLAHIQAMKLM
jgi:hypothetical protein